MRWAVRLGWVLLALLVALSTALLWLDSPAGHDVLARQLARVELENGLRFRVSRLEGSLWRDLVAKDLVVADASGDVALVPELALRWHPLALAGKRFEADRLTAPRLRLLRLPRLRPTTSTTLLPDFDIRIRRLAVARIELAPAITGQARTLQLGGDVDIAAGRLVAHARLVTLGMGSGDRLQLALDSRPDDKVFDADISLNAPANGLIARAAGLKAPLTAELTGDGRWGAWQGRLTARLGNAALADARLTHDGSAFTLAGSALPALLLTGPAARLLAGPLAVRARLVPGDATMALTASIAGPALTGQLDARIARQGEVIETGRLQLALRQPAALHPRFAATALGGTASLAGTLLAPRLTFRLAATRAGWGDVQLLAPVVTGRLALGGKAGLPIDLALAAPGLAGVNANALPYLQQLRLAGRLNWQQGRLQANGVRLVSNRLSGTGNLDWRAASGQWRIGLGLTLPGEALPGVGIGTASAQLLLGPGAVLASGPVQLRVTRLDNTSIAKLSGGLPVLAGQLSVTDNLALALSGLTLNAPDATLAGSASMSADQRFSLALAGQTELLGPAQVTASGTFASPVVNLALAQPGYGFSDVSARLARAGNDWQISASGTSNYGPVRLAGLLSLDAEPALLISNAHVAGFDAQGRLLQSRAGPFVGTLALVGPGLTGTINFSDREGAQLAVLAAKAQDAQLDFATPITLDSGTLNATLLLAQAGPQLTASLHLLGAERSSLLVDKSDGSLNWNGANAGSGHFQLVASGRAGLPFTLNSSGDLADDSARIALEGALDGRRFGLAAPALWQRTGDDWVLAPTKVIAGDGSAEVSGRWGADPQLRARFDHIGMSLLSIAWPGLDLAGRVSGQLDVRLASTGPQGTANITLNGLSRSGIASTSAPVDLGLNARFGPDGSAARAVIKQGATVVGRAQAELAALPAGASLLERLYATAVSARLRFNGPAQALWGLGGLTALDVQGPLQLAADVSGKLGDPQVAGSLAATKARVESPILGLVVTDGVAVGRFTQSRLELSRLAGRSGAGSISGGGSIDLSAERSFPIDIRLTLDKAQVLGRDDIEADASGNIRIATDEYGGVVSGNLNVGRATFRIGRSAVADVPVLAVTERNVRALGRPPIQYAAPTRWLFDLNLRADNRLFVNGMGINSEWQAQLKLRGGATTPELLGRVQLVRGDYDFAGKRFQLTRGDIRFQGVYPPDPIIAIAAENTGNGFTATLSIDGTAQRPNIHFASVPQLPEDEVLSRVLFGTGVTNLSAPEAIQLAGALASLRGGGSGLNPMGMVKKGLGIDRLRILPADATIGRRTAVAAGQYIGRNVYVELATDAQGYTASSIEISLTRSLSLLSQVATLGGTSASVRWKRDY